VSWLNNRKILFKIGLIVFVLGATCVGALTFASQRMYAMGDAYSDLIARVDKSATMAARAGRRVEAYVSNGYQIALETTQEGNKRLLGQINGHRTAYTTLMDGVLKDLPEKASAIQPVIAQFQQAFEACDAAIAFASEATSPEEATQATNRLRKECVPQTSAAVAKQAALVDDIVAHAAASAAKLKQDTSDTIMTVITASAAGLVLSLLLAFWIGIFGLTRPIARLKTVMEAFAGNDLAHDVPGSDRGDELGEMSRTVEVFKVNALEVERMRAEQQATEQQRAEQRKADMNKLADDFELAVGEIIKTVASAATELEASADTLSRTAAKTEELSTTVASAADQASANVQSVASASEEMTGSVNEISRQVQQSAAIASEAVNQASQTNERVTQLSEAASRIGDVIELINSIAGQTNLLALNATIEAARAGDAGRGFAVVASEVKSLAEQTAKATGDIAEQIKGIQTATGYSVESIRQISETIVQISEISASIASAVEEQGAATQEITRNVQQAAQGTTQVATNIVDVQRGSSETGAASSQVLSSAQALSVESERLKTEVDRFMMTVRAA
jgi:methyl-accepting chemotaxis protein